MSKKFVYTVKEERDEQGRIIYQEDSDGRIEQNTYGIYGKLIKQDITYSNGIREVEMWQDGMPDEDM